MKPLIITCGLSGSGKTFHSKKLKEKLAGYRLINLGQFREQLGITTYSRKDTPKMLALAIEEIEKNHHLGFGSLLDANLKTNDLRQCFYDLAKYLGTEVLLIEMSCSDEAARRRMEEREQTTLAENPKLFSVYLEQKKVWQDTLMDLELAGNEHLTVIKYNTESHSLELIKGNLAGSALVGQIVEVLAG